MGLQIQHRVAMGLMAGALTLLTACDAGSETTADTPTRPLVVTTTTMISDLVRQIAGDQVEVIGLLPPGVDPHSYEPRPDDAIYVKKADLVLYNGLHLEGRMTAVFEGAGDKAVPLAEDERITPRAGGKGKGAVDPHFWWNAKYYAIYAERACDALQRIDPDNASLYEERAAAYIDELHELDARIHDAVNKIPADQRVLITSHDAFYYYGEAYGLTVAAVQGITTDADVRALRINELTQLVVDREVPAIFHETSVSAALNEMINRVTELAAKRGHTVSIPERALFSDSLAPPGTPGGTYLDALRTNTRVIVEALGGGDVSEILGEDES